MQDERYARQIPLPQVGPEGQQKLAEANIAVLGAGGLGSPVLLYLAAAGVGRLHVIDGDVVSMSNLNRQVLYTEADIGKPKAERAAARIRQLNPHTEVTTTVAMLDENNGAALLAGHDLLLLCLDSRRARLLANRAAVALGLPVVEGAAEGFSGHVMFFMPGKTACYECLYGQAAPRQGPLYIMGAMAGAVGSLMALTALKHCLGVDAGAGKLWLIDGLHGHTDTVDIQRHPDCPACGAGAPG